MEAVAKTPEIGLPKKQRLQNGYPRTLECTVSGTKYSGMYGEWYEAVCITCFSWLCWAAASAITFCFWMVTWHILVVWPLSSPQNRQ